MPFFSCFWRFTSGKVRPRKSNADLRGMVPELYARKKELQTGKPEPMPAGKKKVTS